MSDLDAARGFVRAVLRSPSPDAVMQAFLSAARAASAGEVALWRRAHDGTYRAVRALDVRAVPGGRRVAPGATYVFLDAADDETAFPVPGSGTPPEFVLVVRVQAVLEPDERVTLEFVVDAFALALRNLALAAEAERRRREVVEARATQAELVERLARDVRGPVTSIVGFARLLEDDGRFPADAREALAVVRGNGERIADLAGEIDLLSRIELATVEPAWQIADLGAVAASAGAVVERSAPSRIAADPELLRSVLARLVDEGRRPLAPVRARVDDLGEAVALDLVGTGPSPAGTDEAPSLGARLALRVVERLRGRLRCEARSDGWTIRIILPVERRAAPRR